MPAEHLLGRIEKGKACVRHGQHFSPAARATAPSSGGFVLRTRRGARARGYRVRRSCDLSSPRNGAQHRIGAEARRGRRGSTAWVGGGATTKAGKSTSVRYKKGHASCSRRPRRGVSCGLGRRSACLLMCPVRVLTRTYLGQKPMSEAQNYSWRGLDLNQRPLGYEPNELPDCSTPLTGHDIRRRGYPPRRPERR